MKAEQLPAPVISQKACGVWTEAAEHVAPAMVLLSPERRLQECKAQPSPDIAADPLGRPEPLIWGWTVTGCPEQGTQG